MGKVFFFAGISFVACALVPVTGAIWYVDVSVSASVDGQSWETAFKSIQEGIDASSDTDTVMVAQGTYVENIQFDGENIALSGTDPLDPAVVAKTIIDGNESGPVVTFSGSEDETCVLSGFTIRNGKAANGGGILGGTSDTPTQATIRHNVIAGNSAAQDGGGVQGCDGLIWNNVISGNSGAFGGGLNGCNGTIRNNLIAVNSAGSGGGLYDCNGTIESNTIAGNVAEVFGGGLRLCRATIGNCVIWGNTAPSEAQLSRSRGPTYSCIQDGAGFGEGSIADDPGFVDADGPDDNPATYEDNNYRLAGGSPCADTGENTSWMEGETDLDGNSRIIYGLSSPTVDMGAYEYLPSKIIAIGWTPNARIEITWTSSAGYTYAIWSSDDLLMTDEWIELATTVSEGDITSWMDPRYPRRARFYRVEVR